LCGRHQNADRVDDVGRDVVDCGHVVAHAHAETHQVAVGDQRDVQPAAFYQRRRGVQPTTLAPAQYTGTGGREIVEAMPWQIGVNRCDRPSPV